MKIQMHFYRNIIVIQGPYLTEYSQLADKYEAGDEDLVSLGSTEDAQMAFESFWLDNQLYLQ
ncbi:hypothetical protein GSI_09414 [Ganoderma sinense ZZ0214-1]|uniref:Uncharacterized protein n=1 Tax=Ganoderma sinense ZZ0214-1 TaxID=1077348 RepID=A0A2G8S6G8_9APHY|nr:hypothetical protein GSI_09414 [Ganoderma sinense ZZ0214-1]